MEKIKLALCAELVKDDLAQLEQYCDITPAGGLKRKSITVDENDLLEDCIGHEMVILAYENATERCLKAWAESGMKLLGCARGTPVNVDWKAVKALGIPFIYAPGRNAVAVAEHTVGLMLAVTRHIAVAYADLLKGMHTIAPVADIYDLGDRKDVAWREPGGPRVLDYYGRGIELYEKRLGLVGYGAIGKQVARIAKGIGMEVVVNDPFVTDEVITQDGYAPIGREKLLKTSDLVSIHLPVNEDTIGLIDKTWFAAMRPDAYFINTSRASIVNQKDFIEAMEQKAIRAAAVDVAWIEPIPVNHPILNMQNVLITPHIGGLTKEVEGKWTSKIIMRDILRYCRGEQLQSLWTKG